MNLRSFKLNRVYLDPLNMSNAGDFPGVELLRILFKFKKRKENSSWYVHVLHKTSNQEVSRRRSCGGGQRNVLTSVMHVQSCCFDHLTHCFFRLASSSSSSSSSQLLKLPIIYKIQITSSYSIFPFQDPLPISDHLFPIKVLATALYWICLLIKPHK